MKQPYKIIRAQFYINRSNYGITSFPRQIAGETPWPNGNNILMVSEEKNVLIKKIIVDTKQFPNGNPPIRYWKALFNFVDKTGSPIQTIQGNQINFNSSPWSQPVGNPKNFTSCNSYKPCNNYLQGVKAGGLEFRYFEIFAWNNSAPFVTNSVYFYVHIYYQDIDENKNLLC